MHETARAKLISWPARIYLDTLFYYSTMIKDDLTYLFVIMLEVADYDRDRQSND